MSDTAAVLFDNEKFAGREQGNKYKRCDHRTTIAQNINVA